MSAPVAQTVPKPTYDPNDMALSPEKRALYKKLDDMRYASSAFMVATIIVALATVILIGLAQARYLTPDIPLYMFCATVPLLIITIAIDNCLRSTARENPIEQIQPEDYFSVRLERVDPE